MLFIYGKSRLEKDWRISISEFFNEEPPNGVVFVVKSGTIELVPESEAQVGAVMVVDNKKRVTIPKWLREELPLECEKILFVFDEETKRRFMIPVGKKSILTFPAPN